jgi:hypothetical protein
MKPNDKKDFMNGKVSIKVNSMYPAGQGYSPRIIEETHFNISFNGHNINITESAFNEMLRVFESEEDVICQGEIVEEEKEKEWIEGMQELVEKEKLEDYRIDYKEKFKKEVPNRYK